MDSDHAPKRNVNQAQSDMDGSKINSRVLSALYGGGVFVAAAAGLVVEIVAARLIAPYVGMSLYTWTAIIAVVLGGMAVGHWIGGRLAQMAARRSMRMTGLAAAAAAASCAATPVMIRVVGNPVLSLDAPHLWLIALLAMLLFFVPSLLIAVLSPVLTKLAIDLAPDRSGIVIGRIFALGATGSIVGTLLAGFVFISYVGSNGTLLVVAGVILLLSLLLLSLARARIAGAAVTVIALLTAGILAVRPDIVLASACTEESAYYCIRVVDFDSDEGRPGRLMVLDHMGHGINDREDPTLLHSSYVELADLIVGQRLGHKSSLRSFFIGGGAYTLPRAWAARYPGGKHVVAEVDQEVTRVAQASFWLRKTGGLEVVHEDARLALQSLKKGDRFDVVVGDAFHDISVPEHLVTREFFTEVRSRLAPDGLFLMTVIDARKTPRFLSALIRTARTVFPSVEIWADADQLVASQRLTYLIVAADRPGSTDKLLSARFPDRAWLRRSPRALQRWLRDPAIPVMTDDLAPVDRLLSGVARAGG